MRIATYLPRSTAPIAVAVALASVACSNSKFCKGNPGNNCDNAWDAAIDVKNGCSGDPDCSGATPVCDLAVSKLCVQCTTAESAACAGTTPVCGTDDVCHACTMHGQCASDVCLPDGSCSDGNNVAYVDPAGTVNVSCTKTLPCTQVVSALATNRPYLKFHGITDEAVTVNGGRTVTFLADAGAGLTRSVGTGAIITVSDNGTSLAVFDLSISDAPNNLSGYGVVIPTASGAPSVALTRAKLTNNPGGGISASGGSLTVTQSNVSGNPGGGISLAATAFDLTNNFIVQNGGPTSVIGGINFGTISAGSHRLDFNTIGANAGASTVNSGVNCGTVTAAITFSNNIIYGNTVSGGGKQIGGSINCATTYSDIGPDTASGTGNVNADPLFANVASGNFHLTSNSPAKDAADPAAMLDVDVDGDVRPQGAGRDIGADEYKP